MEFLGHRTRMPFTPIHGGPGMMVKAVAPRHFSICVFMLTQVVIDLEVLWHLIRWDPPLHRSWHTWAGATVIGVMCFLVGKPVSEWIKTIWNRLATKCV